MTDGSQRRGRNNYGSLNKIVSEAKAEAGAIKSGGGIVNQEPR